MTERYAFKPRPDGHLDDEALDHDGPVFDYIAELHELLWRVTRAVRPGAGGRLTEEFPRALEQLERQPGRPEEMRQALAKYGEHIDGCNSVEAWGEGPHPCDCGLAAAIGPTGQLVQYDTQDDVDLMLARSVGELDLALPSRQALERGGYRTIGDLCRADTIEMGRAFGETSVEELMTRLDQLGLCVGTVPRPRKPDCAVCGHRGKYHGAGSCHECPCEGRFAPPEDQA